jgi:S-adenosylhomocysteine hydrolase
MTDHDVKDLSLAPAGKLKLHAMDIRIDVLTPEQETYLSSWQHGT